MTSEKAYKCYPQINTNSAASHELAFGIRKEAKHIPYIKWVILTYQQVLQKERYHHFLSSFLWMLLFPSVCNVLQLQYTNWHINMCEGSSADKFIDRASYYDGFRNIRSGVDC